MALERSDTMGSAQVGNLTATNGEFVDLLVTDDVTIEDDVSVQGNLGVSGTFGANGAAPQARLAPITDLPAFTDPPSAAEMAALRTAVNGLLAGDRAFGFRNP